MPTHSGGRRIVRWYRGRKYQRVPKMYLRGRLIHQLDALVSAFAAAATGLLPAPGSLARAGTRVFAPSVGAFVAGPDDPIWLGDVGDVGRIDRSDPRLSGVGGLPQRVRSSGAPNRPVIDRRFAEYLFLVAGTVQALVEDGVPVDTGAFDVRWYAADAPGQPALRRVRGGNPAVYEIVPDALRGNPRLRVKEETWRFRCRIAHGDLAADLPERGFVELTVPGVPGAPSTLHPGVRGIGVEVELDLAHAILPYAIGTYDRPAAEAAPPGPGSVPAGEVRAVRARTVSLVSDFARASAALADDTAIGQRIGGMEYSVAARGIVVTGVPDRGQAYDRSYALQRSVAVDWAQRGAEGGAQWEMGSFVHLRLRNRTPLSLPAAPTGLTATAERMSFRLAWDLPNDPSIDRYDVQYKLQADTEWTDEDTGLTTGYTVSVLVDGSTGLGQTPMLADGDYDLRVRAVNGLGEGPWAMTTGSLVDGGPGPGETIAIPEIEQFSVAFEERHDRARLNWKQIEWAGDATGDALIGWRRRTNRGTVERGGPWGPWFPLTIDLEETLDTTQHYVTGLMPDTYYGFQLRLGYSGRTGPETEERGGFYRRTGQRVVTIDAPSVVRPSPGEEPVEMVFRVMLSEAEEAEVTLDYADTGEGTATEGVDYERFEGGTLTYAPGETEKAITVLVRGGPLQGDETVVVELSNLMGARFLDNPGTAVEEEVETLRGTGTILASAGLQIDSPSVGEPESGSANMTFTVELRPAYEEAVQVTARNTDTGSATEGTDYAPFRQRRLTFAPGETIQTFDVRVLADEEDDEGDETVVVELVDATAGVPIVGARGTGTILGGEKDMNPHNYRWTISDADPLYDDEAGALRFEVTMEYIGDMVPVEVSADVEDSGEGTATSGTDYQAVPLQSVHFANTGSTTIEVPIIVDEDAEPDETVILLLTPTELNGITGVADRDRGTGVILGDPEVSFEGGSVAEPAEGETAVLPFTVRLERPLGAGRTGRVAYSDLGTGSATSGEDYDAVPSSTLEIQAGESEATIEVRVRGDDQPDPDETVDLQISAPRGVVFPGGAATLDATGTIAAQAMLSLSIDSPVGIEPEPGASPNPLRFTVSLEVEPDGPLPEPVTVDVADTGDGTATSGRDYIFGSTRTLTFSGEERSHEVVVDVLADSEIDHQETVVLELRNPSSDAMLATAQGTGTIQDYCHSIPPLNWLPGQGEESFGVPPNVNGPRFNVSVGHFRIYELPEADPETICNPDTTFYHVYLWMAHPMTGDIITSNRHRVSAHPDVDHAVSFRVDLAPGEPRPTSPEVFDWVGVVYLRDELTGIQSPTFNFPVVAFYFP